MNRVVPGSSTRPDLTRPCFSCRSQPSRQNGAEAGLARTRACDFAALRTGLSGVRMLASSPDAGLSCCSRTSRLARWLITQLRSSDSSRQLGDGLENSLAQPIVGNFPTFSGSLLPLSCWLPRGPPSVGSL